MKIHLPAYEPSLECTERLRHGEIDIDLGEDVVRVVFCKDCEHYKQNPWNQEEMMCMCWSDWLPTEPTDFCSYGERRDTE